jgi:hypothetical protein
MGSHWRLVWRVSGRKSRFQIGLPSKSKQPIEPQRLKNQTCSPSAIGAKTVASLKIPAV